MGGIDSDFDFGPFIRHAPKVQKTKTGSLLMHMCIDDNEPLLPLMIINSESTSPFSTNKMSAHVWKHRLRNIIIAFIAYKIKLSHEVSFKSGS